MKLTRAQKFKQFNSRIRAWRVVHARALDAGNPRRIREAIRAMRKLRNRIALLPRFGDTLPPALGQGIFYSAQACS